MMLALLFALTVIIIGIGLLCYLVDVLIGEQRQTNSQLDMMRKRSEPATPSGKLYREWLEAETRRRRGGDPS